MRRRVPSCSYAWHDSIRRDRAIVQSSTIEESSYRPHLKRLHCSPNRLIDRTVFRRANRIVRAEACSGWDSGKRESALDLETSVIGPKRKLHSFRKTERIDNRQQIEEVPTPLCGACALAAAPVVAARFQWKMGPSQLGSFPAKNCVQLQTFETHHSGRFVWIRCLERFSNQLFF